MAKTSGSLILLYVAMVFSLTALPLAFIVTYRSRRAEAKERWLAQAREEARIQHIEQPAHGVSIPLTALPLPALPPPVAARPKTIKREPRKIKELPAKIYHPQLGVFERAVLNDQGIYEAPKSFLENELPQILEARRKVEEREAQESIARERALPARKTHERPVQKKVSFAPCPPTHLRENTHLKNEGRLLTPEVIIETSVPEKSVPAPFQLNPAPKQFVKRRGSVASPGLRKMSNAQAGASKSPKIHSFTATTEDVQDADDSFIDVPLYDAPAMTALPQSPADMV